MKTVTAKGQGRCVLCSSWCNLAITGTAQCAPWQENLIAPWLEVTAGMNCFQEIGACELLPSISLNASLACNANIPEEYRKGTCFSIAIFHCHFLLPFSIAILLAIPQPVQEEHHHVGSI